MLCSANPLLRTTFTFGIERSQLVEDRVAVHHRQEEIENDEADLFADLLVNSQRLEAVFREDDLVALLSQHLGGDL